MGCMYSKAIARSMSIREELNHGFHRTSSVAWEELLTSHGGADQLFALVYSPQTSNATFPSPDVREIPLEENNENKLHCGDQGSTGSRSFHTVEEYDALLERIRKFSTRSVQHFEDCGDYSPGSDVEVRGINHDLDEDQNDGCVQEIGWKRKLAGKELEPLEITTIEFPDIGRWRQQRVCMEGGAQVYSPVTPKFGSYNGRVTCRAHEKHGGENSVVSRELAAAFEDCMQQLEDEEELESFLRQMDEHDFPPNEDQTEVPLSMKNDI